VIINNGRKMHEVNEHCSDVREESSSFQLIFEPMIVRQLRREIVRRRFGRMGKRAVGPSCCSRFRNPHTQTQLGSKLCNLPFYM
jgi:hypothetical protein